MRIRNSYWPLLIDSGSDGQELIRGHAVEAVSPEVRGQQHVLPEVRTGSMRQLYPGFSSIVRTQPRCRPAKPDKLLPHPDILSAVLSTDWWFLLGPEYY